MEGWKTKAGGIGVILTGLGLIVTAIAATPFSLEMLILGVGTASGGLTAMGIGHKSDKLKAVLGTLTKSQ